MEKFKEILFLKNLKRVGNSAINGKYNKILTESNDLNDLFLKIKQNEDKFSDEDLQKAKDNAEEIFEQVVNSEVNVITVFDENYPKRLNVMKNSKPTILYVKGNVNALKNPNIAIIGTRNPSKLSQDFEKSLVKHILNSTNKTIVSGLALGCDKIAHQTTVDENKTTIAFLPSWIETITPASNKNLAEDIIKTGGCLVSEYGPDTKVYKSNYLNRDKIVAAFSDCILVVECGINSGTMHTVNDAIKFKRRIYTYIPNERPEELYQGNIEILKKNKNAIQINSIEDFNNLKIEKNHSSVEKTLDDY